MNKPVLLIMAAGLGSRYGGLKQIDPIGPNGEILLEFALGDAIALGIEKAVVIVSESIKDDFESMIVPKYPELKITLVVQTIENIPQLGTLNFELGTGALARSKPWGTAHAVWCARNAIEGSFIVMNADDFYGRDALKQAFDFLVATNSVNIGNVVNPVNNSHCIITYPITSTLSNYGTVSRGICEVQDGKLTKIVEHTKVGWKIEKKGGIKNYELGDSGKKEKNPQLGTRTLVHTAEDGHEIPVSEDAPANMNLFGFQQSFFDVLDQECHDYFEKYISDPKREFFLPSVVMQIIKKNLGTITALSTTSPWFGMTYPEDRAEAKNKIEKMTQAGQL